MTVKFSLTPDAFAWLSQAFSDKSPISPLLLCRPSGGLADEAIAATLIADGIIEKDGTITGKALPALQALAGASMFSRIRVLGTHAPVDKVVYFGEGLPCSVDSAADSLEVSYPAMNQEAGYVLAEFTGSSRLVNVTFSARLSPLDACVMLTLIDLFRMSSLSTLAGHSAPLLFAPEEIAKEMELDKGYLAFRKTLQASTGLPDLTSEAVSESLERLTAAGHAVKSGNSYGLQGSALELATSFLIPEYVFDLSFGRVLPDGAVEQSGCSVVVCGMHNLLYVDPTGDDVLIETISGSDTLEMLLSAISEGALV